VRISARTQPDGTAGVIHRDRDEKLRIGVGTSNDGAAAISIYDRTGTAIWSK
jgi:hypothetical protein